MENKNYNTDATNKELISKTKLKKRMNELQCLGLRLTKISKNQLMEINIPGELINEIENYKKIKSNSALKRQLQYIRKLISKLDEELIKKIIDFFHILDGKNKVYQAKIKKIEQTIKNLLNEDGYITVYIQEKNNININELRTLIRNVQKDKAENKITKNYKLLYNLVKNNENFIN